MKITFRYRLLASYILLIAIPLLVLGGFVLPDQPEDYHRAGAEECV
ncbi:hypothetical protein ACFTAO_39235 [Paenibacillus rhizoplanae]